MYNLPLLDFPRGGRDHPYPPPPPSLAHHTPMSSRHPHPPSFGPPHGAVGSPSSRSFPFADSIDPNATRSLFVGNIPKNINIYELRDVFMRFGPVLVSELTLAHTSLVAAV